jgi:hypothetical protein
MWEWSGVVSRTGTVLAVENSGILADVEAIFDVYK